MRCYSAFSTALSCLGGAPLVQEMPSQHSRQPLYRRLLHGFSPKRAAEAAGNPEHEETPRNSSTSNPMTFSFDELDRVQEEARALYKELEHLRAPGNILQKIQDIDQDIDDKIAYEKPARATRSTEENKEVLVIWKDIVRALKELKKPVYSIVSQSVKPKRPFDSSVLKMEWAQGYPRDSMSHESWPELECTIWFLSHPDVKIKKLIDNWIEKSEDVKKQAPNTRQHNTTQICCKVTDAKHEADIRATLVVAQKPNEFDVAWVDPEAAMFTVLCFNKNSLMTLENLEKEWLKLHRDQRRGSTKPLILLGLDPCGVLGEGAENYSRVVIPALDRRIKQCQKECGANVYFEVAQESQRAWNSFFGTILGLAAALRHPLPDYHHPQQHRPTSATNPDCTADTDVVTDSDLTSDSNLENRRELREGQASLPDLSGIRTAPSSMSQHSRENIASTYQHE